MKRLVLIKCKTCKKTFFPKSEKNVFCNRKCFKKDFYHRKKTEDLKSPKFPIFKCPSCSRNIEVNFDPTKEDRRWLDFSCPFCNFLLISVCEEISTQDSSNF